MTIRLRLTIFNAVILVLTILAALGLAGASVGIFLFRDPYHLVSAPAQEVAYRIANGETLTAADLDRIANSRVAITILDADGVNLAASDVPNTVKPSGDYPIWDQVPASGEPLEYEFSDADGNETFATVLPLKTNGVVTGYVDSRSSYEAIVVALFEEYVYVPIIAAAFLPVALVLILTSYILTWRALRPVNRIAAEANKISETDLNRRLPVQGGKRDEFARLSLAINGLLDRIQRSVLEREAVLAAQRRFVADAGHELRTPLTSIRGYARMLGEWGLQDENVAREGVEIIERESTRLHDLAEGLLVVARGDEQLAPELVNGDLRIPVSEAIEAMKLNSRGAIFEPVIPDKPVMALLDEQRVRQLVTILLDNAIKYSPTGASVNITVASSGGLPALVVRDSGIGISEQDLPRIFDRFYRIDEARGNRGAGLGLAIAHQIADAHGGRIIVQSYLGHGTRFTVTFQPPRTEVKPSAPSQTRRFVHSLLVRLHLRTPEKS